MYINTQGEGAKRNGSFQSYSVTGQHKLERRRFPLSTRKYFTVQAMEH